MSESSVSVRARCESCDAIYRVPTAERTYTCRSCNGTVRAVAEDQNGDPEPDAGVRTGSVACPECDVIQPGGLQFCSECGTSLPESKARPGSEAARRLREEATDALKRASRGFQIVTWTYQTGAVAYALATLFAVRALADPEVPLGGGVIVVVLTTLLSVLFGMGALHAHFKPFVWTVAIAAATTVVTLIHLVGPNPFGLAALGSAAWAVVAYGLLVPTFWFRKQIAKHRDLYILQHASNQTRRALRGRPAEERHERLLETMRRAARRQWVLSASIAGLVVLASTVGSWFYLTELRPAPFGSALARFEKAWQTGDILAVGNVFEDGFQKLATDRLTGSASGHGWGSRLPRLGKVASSRTQIAPPRPTRSPASRSRSRGLWSTTNGSST